jgi:hypothetical protein
MACTPLQLNAGCPAGQSQPFYSIGSDGTQILFNLPTGLKFALTDISLVIANISPGPPTLVSAGIQQTVGTNQVQRWVFAGYILQNVERSFITPIILSTPFDVQNGGAAYLNVNLFGYLIA